MSDASDSQPPVERAQPAEGLPHPQPPLAQSPWPYPQQQGFPQQAPPVSPGFPSNAYPPPAAAEPDWAALAQEQERSNSRRKRALLIGGGVLAAAAVAGIVVTTIVLTGGKDVPGPTPTKTAADKSPSPTPTVPKTPLDVISSTGTDKAPVTIAALFPAQKITVQGREYVFTAHDVESDCANGLANGLGEILNAKGCLDIYRVTYVSGPTEVTVGVTTFRTAAAATAAKAATKGNVTPLVAGKVTPFCQNVTCRTTQNSLGRYAYFTVAGPGDGKPVADNDQNAMQAGRDIADSVYENLTERGRAGLADQPVPSPSAPVGIATAPGSTPAALTPSGTPSH